MVYEHTISTNKIDPSNRQSVVDFLNHKERELLSKGGISGFGIFDVECNFERLPLKNGGIVKRGNAYGCIKYHHDGQEISREDAIKEIMKPSELRKAIHDIESMQVCSLCGDTKMGTDIMYRWRILSLTSYHGTTWEDARLKTDAEITLCDTCIMTISKGRDAIMRRLLQ